MVDFDDTYNQWRAASFPNGSANDAVDELHAQLAQWDALVADEVIPIAGGHSHRPGAVNNIAMELETLCARIGSLVDGIGPADQELLRQYGEYCALLSDVYGRALRHASSSHPGDAS
jgi:hypothetical protein